jgi:hypothetical protein
MPRVTILIRYLALLRHEDNGLRVLFPSKEHDLYIEHAFLGCVALPKGQKDIVLKLENQRHAEEVTPASRHKVARLEDIAGEPITIRSEILSGQPHSDLNARLLLGGGAITPLDPYAAPHLKGKEWKIKDDYKPVLTDTLEYAVDLQAGEWRLEIPDVATLDLSHGGQIIIENRDRPDTSPDPDAVPDLELKEFRDIYAFTKNAGHEHWPIPKLQNAPVPPQHRRHTRAALFGPSRPLF